MRKNKKCFCRTVGYSSCPRHRRTKLVDQPDIDGLRYWLHYWDKLPQFERQLKVDAQMLKAIREIPHEGYIVDSYESDVNLTDEEKRWKQREHVLKTIKINGADIRF